MTEFNEFFNAEEIRESQEVGDYLADRYLTEVLKENEGREAENISITSNGLPLEDVNIHLSTLRNQLNLMRRFGIERVPAHRLDNGHTLPFDIIQYIENSSLFFDDNLGIRQRFFYRYPEDVFYQLIDDIGNSGNKNFTTLSVSSIGENLYQNLKKFLSYRHAALFNDRIKERIKSFFSNKAPTDNNSNQNNSGGNTPPNSNNATQYLTITVHTPGYEGLSVSAAPAFFASWRKFGSPSSPVKGSLLPGTYIFGAKGMSLPKFKKDSMAVDIPPNFDITINL